MLRPFGEIPSNPGAPALRRFGLRTLVLSLGAALFLTVLASLGWPAAAFLDRMRLGMLAVAGWGLAGTIVPAAIRPLFWMVHVLTALLTYLVSVVLLAAFYYLFLTPIAGCLRVRGRDPLRLARPMAESQWQPHVSATGVRQYYRQY